jgi:hypothetical protein
MVEEVKPKRLMAMQTTEDEYKEAGSKFVSPPATMALIPENLGKRFTMLVKGVGLDWKDPGVSYDFTVSVQEKGINEGMTQSIFGGAQAKSIWSSKKYYEALAGKPMPMVKGPDGQQHPNPDPDAVVGKTAVGVWEIQKDKRSADEGGTGTIYPKLIDIIPATSSKKSAEVPV